MSDDVAKTTSLQRLIMTSFYEMLQQRRFCNVVRRFHRNYMTQPERRWIATSQQRCNDVFVSTGLHQKYSLQKILINGIMALVM